VSVPSGTISAMSTRNRAKRAAKVKDRRRAARERPSSWFGGDRVVTQEMLVRALRSAAMCGCGEVDEHVAEIIRTAGAEAPELDIAADTAVASTLRNLWEGGWTPIDLHEIGRRRLDAAIVEYLDEAIVVESRRYAPAMIHPRWAMGLAAVAAGVEVGSQTPHLRHWAARRGLTRPSAMRIVLQMLGMLGALPRLERMLPLPGESRHVSGPVAEVDEKMLAKVRGLLAKAESTEFPDEAEALSAKAQELMSRYALHQAVLDHDRGRVPIAGCRRIWLDAPYATAKAHLVDAVASANRCRAIWSESLGFTTVIGTETDLGLVELLTTSLLLQANRAMLAAGRQVSRSGSSRTRSFRQSFLVAYASRIRERLAEVDSAGVAEMQRDERLLPVLAARSRAVEDLTAQLFPSVVQRSVSVSNGAGWTAGRAAADLALFDVHRPIAG
jgi:hypothetical protein